MLAPPSIVLIELNDDGHHVPIEGKHPTKTQTTVTRGTLVDWQLIVIHARGLTIRM